MKGIIHDKEDREDGDGRIMEEEEERDYRLSNWSTWVVWYRYVGGIFCTVGIFFALAVNRFFMPVRNV